MARPRKPTKLHVIQGSLHTTRHRDRAGEPEVVEPLGPPPDSWPPKGKSLWGELEEMVPAGVATKADRIAFELLTRLVAEMRSDPGKLTPALASQIRTCCAVFGMTPADRSRVTAVQSVEPNPFSKL